MSTRRPQSIPVADAHEPRPQRPSHGADPLALAGRDARGGRARRVIRPRPGQAGENAFPGSESGVLVLDMSASVGRPGRSFLRPIEYLSKTGQDFGLVVFSDVAYEAVPPGTSASELSAYLRIFRPARIATCRKASPVHRGRSG